MGRPPGSGRLGYKKKYVIFKLEMGIEIEQKRHQLQKEHSGKVQRKSQQPNFPVI